MIPLDCLSCLDGLLWLRTQERAARKLKLAQSSVSRNAKRCCEVFGVSLEKMDKEYKLCGDLTLVNMERDVHQYYEWHTAQPLRIDGQQPVHPVLQQLDDDRWVFGNFDYTDLEHPLWLLRFGVVDVWILHGEQVPADHDHELASVPLLPDQRTEHLVVRRRYVDHGRFLSLRQTLSDLLATAMAASRTIGTDQRPSHGAPVRLKV